MGGAYKPHSPGSAKGVVAKIALSALAVGAVLTAAVYVAFKISPWPFALLIRRAFHKDAVRVSREMARHVPPGVSGRLNERYDATDEDAYLDVFYPSAIENSKESLPTIVWVHGGAWISGTKEDIANYARILASKGYIAVGIDYSVAPGKTYPTPVRQVNAALAYLVKNSERLHVDQSRFFLAGDSGGAHIAAQVANVISAPSYAKVVGLVPSIQPSQLKGMILFCGAYDVGRVRFDGLFGSFLKTVLWSYSGNKNFINDPYFATASVINYLTPEFPPAFISTGNADPLEPESRAFAEALASRGIRIDSLFFPKAYEPSLAHEYQFDLDSDASRLALERTVRFLSTQ